MHEASLAQPLIAFHKMTFSKISDKEHKTNPEPEYDNYYDKFQFNNDTADISTSHALL